MLPNHTGFQDGLALTIGLCLIYTVCIAALRVWIRKSAYGIDDAVIAAATVVTFGHAASDIAARCMGLGLSWADLQAEVNLRAVNEASISGVVTFIVALYLSKCAMLSFLTRIIKSKSQIYLYHSCNCAVALLGVASVIIATAGCSTESQYYWAFHANQESCPGQATRWQVITGLDIITEILVLALPLHLVWGLQMPLLKKAMLILAFYLRLPSLGFAIARNYYTLQLRLPGSDAGLDSSLVVIWLEIQLTWALTASTLSALKAFTANFSSGFGFGFTRGKGGSTYGLSDVTANSGESSKQERKSKISTGSSGAETTFIRSPDLERRLNAIPISPLTHEPLDLLPDTTLKLHPDNEKIQCITHICADPTANSPHDGRFWRNGSSIGSHTDEQAIFKEIGYEIHNDDEIPILPIGTPPCRIHHPFHPSFQE